MTDGPTFIGVGPEKTGTTWVHYNLAKQPGFWLPPIKELRFFWEDLAVPAEGIVSRYFVGDEWHKLQYRDDFNIRIRSFRQQPLQTLTSGRARLRWDLSYLLRKHSDDWYLASFNLPAQLPVPQHKGEISPQYFFLPEPQLIKIRKLLPNARVLITLREPVAWCWSFCKMIERQGELERDYGSARDFFQQKAESNSFATSMSLWKKHFGDDVKVFFYEDLQRDGRGFLDSVLEFLDVGREDRIFTGVEDTLNTGRGESIPAELREFGRDLFRGDVLELQQLLGGLPSEWTASEPAD